MSGPLDRLVREAREDAEKRRPAIDWDKVDAKLFSRLDALQREERRRFAFDPGRAWTATAATALAAAAVVALVFGRSTERVPLATTRAAAPPEVVGTVVEVRAPGRAHVRGGAVEAGTPIALGDELDAEGGDVLIERSGKLRLIVERGSRVRITHGHDPVVVALERGAVEADVTPVPSGEAFAVDVDRSRIAVHGTHLRVARMAARVQLDLSEGVVSVGEAPREGALVGAMVAAPAHVEFSVVDRAGSWTLSHDPSTLRARAVWPVAPREPEPAVTPLPRSGEHPPDVVEQRSPAAPLAKTSEPHAASAPALVPSVPPAAPAPGTPSPEEVVTSAIRACMAERPRADNVTVVVRSTLVLELFDDGSVRSARFSPPVLPDVNECASPTIFRTRFSRGGEIEIPVEFKN